ncbi:MAG: AAA family ATPase [Bacteroidales bacterium]|nr:AAA family ATPase [Bacteroidales bacterium]MCF8457493.1 AAA family ATPase [Bacteroidales bacterium]
MPDELKTFKEDFKRLYGKGTIVRTIITEIIYPSQVVTQFQDEFIGRLSILDISYCLPDAEERIKQFKIGDSIECVVLDIDFNSKQVKLGQKHLVKTLSETTKWERIEQGDEFHGTILEELYDFYLVSTRENVYGFLHKSFIDQKTKKIKVKVSSKLDYSELLSFVPATLEMESDAVAKSDIKGEYTFIESDLISYPAFKRSLLGINASDDDHDLISDGFELDSKIFSKEISTEHTLYLQFELNSPAYETNFKQNAIPFFLEGETNSPENEKKVLEILSKQVYWFKLNRKRNEFSVYNENLYFWGDIKESKDKKETRFIIKVFSVGQTFSRATEEKKKNAKYGSFLLSNAVKVVSPFGTIPIGDSQRKFADFAELKTDCFHTIYRLKKDASEILRQEGRTLAIIDRFLDYQISLLDDRKEENVFVDRFKQVPSSSGGISIQLPVNIGDSLEIEEETVVNIRLKENDKLLKLADGVICNVQGVCKLIIYKPIRLELLDQGFYLDKRIDKRQFEVQKEIIKDFLDKKIQIDHIESLLVEPDRIKSPVLSRIELFNEDLKRTEIESPDNNQIAAVRKAVGNKNIFLIQGPPGTGKTTVIAEIIQQLVLKGEKILVSGQNHVAVDNVLGKISKYHYMNLLRVGNPDRVDENLVRYNIDYLVEDYKTDYKEFINNQLILAKKYLECIDRKHDEILEIFNEEVNRLIESYGKLKEVFKARHFILRDGLSELSQKEISDVIESLERWKESNNNEYEVLLKPLIYNSVDVVIATCIGIKTDRVFRELDLKFDTVIIDEAGKANIAETLVAVELGKKVILVGDQKQLPPYMDSSLIDEKDPLSFPRSEYGSDYIMDEIIHALSTSFFEFIVNRIDANQFPKVNKEMLNYQHRMHPNIGKFVSNSFYSGQVNNGNKTHLNRLNLPMPFNKEIIFFDTSNSENPYEQTDGYSAKNNSEAEAISEFILPKLFNHNISAANIAIIAPYKSQVANIKRFISSSTLCSNRNIDVSTLDSFQGKEYDIILFSFTRSSNHRKAPVVNCRKKYTKVGFLDDARRLNVAFSRAKKKLILIGNSLTLTDRRSHFDGFFPYTQLFERLVKLSKDEAIGNFVNITDYHGFKSPFSEFVEKYKEGQIVFGTCQDFAVSQATNKPYGRFILIDRYRALAPYAHKNEILNARFNKGDEDEKVVVKIIQIDHSTKWTTVEILHDPWYKKLERAYSQESIDVLVEEVWSYGYLLSSSFGLKGLIKKNKVKGMRITQGDPLSVLIESADMNKKRVFFKMK